MLCRFCFYTLIAGFVVVIRVSSICAKSHTLAHINLSSNRGWSECAANVCAPLIISTAISLVTAIFRLFCTFFFAFVFRFRGVSFDLCVRNRRNQWINSNARIEICVFSIRIETISQPTSSAIYFFLRNSKRIKRQSRACVCVCARIEYNFAWVCDLSEIEGHRTRIYIPIYTQRPNENF